MGCGASQEADPEGQKRNDEIEAQLKREKNNQRLEVKMLLLGAGESGKSTVLKQMKLIHHERQTKEDRESFKEAVFTNTVQSMQVLIEAMDSLGITYGDPDLSSEIQLVRDQPAPIDTDTMPLDLANAITKIWRDPGVQSCFMRSNEYQLNDSAQYFFDSVARLTQPNYIPTDQDILHVRIKTTGIIEVKFKLERLTYRVVDVGGQRSERKKWIHCFEGVDALLFLVAISEYDQQLFEDQNINRMAEALTLFDTVCNSQWFIKSSIILFLNKTDIFQEKLERSPLSDYYPEYDGGADYNKASRFLKDMFLSLNKSRSREIYTHFTCATDTRQIKVVLDAVNDILVQNALHTTGLL